MDATTLAWVRAVKLSEEDAQNVLKEQLRTLEQRIEQLRRYDALLEEAAERPRYAPYVAALRTLRGVDTLTALGIVAELRDLRRYGTAPQLMAAIRLVPSEYSTGEKTHRFGITKTGNNQVRHVAIEAAWHYQRTANEGKKLQQRRRGQPAAIVDIARPCDARLHRRFHRLTSRGKPSNLAVVAVARELIGFIWAIGPQFDFQTKAK